MAYTLHLTPDEYNSLAWIADRYLCAEILFDALEATDDTDVYSIPEHKVWEYVAALPEENNNPNQVVPPCAGGTLATKLLALFDSVV